MVRTGSGAIPGQDPRAADGAPWRMRVLAREGGDRRAPVAGGVPRADRPRLQLFHLVGRCGDFADGLRELVRAVRELEGDTLSVRRFTDQARRLWPDRLDTSGGGADHAPGAARTGRPTRARGRPARGRRSDLAGVARSGTHSPTA